MSRVRTIMLVLAGTAGAVWVSSCGDGAVEPPPPLAPVATAVTVNPGSAALSALGAKRPGSPLRCETRTGRSWQGRRSRG